MVAHGSSENYLVSTMSDVALTILPADVKATSQAPRIHNVRRSSYYPPCGRQSDVTGTVSAPVTSPHFESGGVMTSPDCVCAGSDSDIILEDQPISRRGSGPPSLHEQPARQSRRAGCLTSQWRQDYSSDCSCLSTSSSMRVHSARSVSLSKSSRKGVSSPSGKMLA